MDTPSPQKKPQSQGASWQQSLQESSGYLGLGMQLALTMAFFVGAGYLLDRWLDTGPWLLAVGAVVGMAAVFVQLFRVVGEMNKKSQATRTKAGSKSTPDQREA